MSLSESPDPDIVSPRLQFGMVRETAEGIRFYLRLSFRDETIDPPKMGDFEHEWTVPWVELDLAEQSGNVDQLLIEIRKRQERTFVHRIAEDLRRTSTRLCLMGDDLVARREA